MCIFNRCKHKWQTIQELTTESKSEQHTRVTGKVLTPEDIKVAKELFAKKHITILSCSECGEIKRYVEEI